MHAHVPATAPCPSTGQEPGTRVSASRAWRLPSAVPLAAALPRCVALRLPPHAAAWADRHPTEAVAAATHSLQVSTVLGVAVPKEREESAWSEGVAIWVAVLVVSLVGEQPAALPPRYHHAPAALPACPCALLRCVPASAHPASHPTYLALFAPASEPTPAPALLLTPRPPNLPSPCPPFPHPQAPSTIGTRTASSRSSTRSRTSSMSRCCAAGSS